MNTDFLPIINFWFSALWIDIVEPFVCQNVSNKALKTHSYRLLQWYVTARVDKTIADVIVVKYQQQQISTK